MAKIEGTHLNLHLTNDRIGFEPRSRECKAMFRLRRGWMKRNQRILWCGWGNGRAVCRLLAREGFMMLGVDDRVYGRAMT